MPLANQGRASQAASLASRELCVRANSPSSLFLSIKSTQRSLHRARQAGLGLARDKRRVTNFSKIVKIVFFANRAHLEVGRACAAET
jgi:hypothetical protein